MDGLLQYKEGSHEMKKTSFYCGAIIFILIFILCGCNVPSPQDQTTGVLSSPPSVGGPSLADLLTKGQHLYQQKSYQSANYFFSLAVKQYPKSADAHAWYGLNLGEMASATKGSAANDYGFNSFCEVSKALNLDPNNILGHLGRGKALLFAPPPFQSINQAIADFKFVLAKQPENVAAQYYLALAYSKNGQKR